MFKRSKGVDVELVMAKFNYCCGMPSMHGAMDKTHIHIAKPIKTPFLKDYYYYKTSGYSIMAQEMIKSRTYLIDVFIGLLESVNDCKVLIYIL
jgi:hypothetical protein